MTSETKLLSIGQVARRADRAHALAATIEDAEDRQVVMDDLAILTP